MDKNNDNLKEKAISQSELENVSGGFYWHFPSDSGTYYIDIEACRQERSAYSPNASDCRSRCYWTHECKGLDFIYDPFGRVVITKNCDKCGDCIKYNWCAGGAIKWKPYTG
jgi:NAD-dependent dihydropyrimidine dehydrogenase PreA subunit